VKTRVGVMLSVLTTACSFAPPYHVPDTGPKPESFKEAADWKTAQPRDTQQRGAWWLIFQDESLDALETQAAAANQSLQAGFARLAQARQDTRIARADLFPTVTADGHATRGKFSPNAPRFLPGYPTMGNDFLVEGDVSYELDLWGRIRNQVASAKATQQASAADLASLSLSIEAELAMDYLSLRSRDRQQALLDETVRSYSKALDLIENLFNGGAAALTDVAQQRAQVESARTQAADNRLMRAQLEHAIAVLTGANPSAFHIATNPLREDAAPPAIDPGLPSDLLERRPDIAEAERRVAAANAQIGVARAAYFPQFTLVGAFGYESTQSYNWLSAPSNFWSLGPQLMLPIFEGGRLRAQTARNKAAYDEQVANYRNTVLKAYQDVEDNLAALHELEEEDRTEAAAVEATRTAQSQAQYRYDAGTVTYLEVSTAENAALQAQLTALSIQLRRISAGVLLVKALGGGWDTAAPAPASANR
jgi:NodT family efflux transporter outer membrane factor (OMF) lipoprotein